MRLVNPFIVTVSRPSESEGRVSERGKYAHVWIRCEPLGELDRNEFNSELRTHVPSDLINASEDGGLSVLAEGLGYEYPVLGISATLFDGSYHELDSRADAFYEASAAAISRAFNLAGPVVMEAILDAAIDSPIAAAERVVSIFEIRRAKVVSNRSTDPGVSRLIATIPYSELAEIRRDLLRLDGSIQMDYSLGGYEVMPDDPDPTDGDPANMAAHVA